ncbi:uncharacterized protein LOC115887075 [Sitophilus oryzae]|uniref:Uncharacterized protein LOC115887075 n=1 Tax=Sitophilus oryzae TaxID=7048 RepID=A0A6J2YG19_SITOR|nr:uncharacterized protein LOC115887075 [Sitophilus oryzae]
MHRCSYFSFLRLAVREYSTKFDKTILQISDEVNSALAESKPIVALESTIITHGMPFPDNIRCALEVENIVRSQGAVPATIALLNGKIKVGMTKAEIEYLGDTQTSKPIKTSRRDFPYLLSMKRNGGTTVSGTIIVSNLVGISVFATGGIGGVHRGAEKSFDISADLTELGRSNVAVVSSGVKSILDIPKTLEYMETQGIFVATLGTNRDFPAFYSQSSGCIAPYFINDARSAAKVIKSHQDIALQSGILFAVPVPKEYAIDYEVIDNAIEKALDKAKERGIEGKNITPFLLSEIAMITSGNSLTTNIALIKNNAKVASNIAVELEKLKRDNRNIEMKEDDSGEILPAQPVIIGGCNLDCVAHLEASEIKDGSAP